MIFECNIYGLIEMLRFYLFGPKYRQQQKQLKRLILYEDLEAINH